MLKHYLHQDCNKCAALTQDDWDIIHALVELLAAVLKNSGIEGGVKVTLWLSYDNNQISFGAGGISEDIVQLLEQSKEHVIHILQDAAAVAKELPNNRSRPIILSSCQLVMQQDGSISDFGWIVDAMSSEHSVDCSSLTESAIQTFFTRMINPASGFYIQQSDGKYSNSYRYLTLNDIKNHLAGSITIGFPAVDENGYCKWICIDEDNILLPDTASHLDKLEKYFKEYGYHTLREGTRPEGNGLKQGHLWIFLSRPILAKYARAWIFKATDELGLGSNNTELKRNKLELFPKQDKAANLANPIRGPLGRHVKAGGNRGYFWGVPYKVNEQLEWFANQPLNLPDQIEKEGELLSKRQQERYELARRQFENNNKILAINGKLDFAHIYKALDPIDIDGQNYCICICPKCHQRRAYFYKDSGQIKCNRIYNCGYELSINSFKKMFTNKRSA